MRRQHFEWRGTQFVPITRTGWGILGGFFILLIAICAVFTVALLRSPETGMTSVYGLLAATAVWVAALLWVNWIFSKPAG
jgi:hypothetical protein